MSENTCETPQVDEATLLNDERAMRRSRRRAMIDAGKEPYAHKYDLDAHNLELEDKYADLEPGESTEDVVRIAGRIVAIRNQGKIAFAVLRDSTGDIQLFCRINDMREQDWEMLDSLDLGDFIGVEGTVLRTRRGQLSIAPTELTFLTKSCRPLPEKFHGLSDRETRYRQRYVDLVMNPEVKQTFLKRFKIIAAIRAWLASEDFLEVETPMLHPIMGGANARPFITHHNALDMNLYLRIAPELNLKRLLVGGYERVFELNRCFRNEGMDQTHNPEFTTMEAYQAYTDVEGMKLLAMGCIKAANAAVNDSEQIMYQGQVIDLSGVWASRPMTEIVSDVCGCEITMDTPIEELREHATKHGVEVKPEWTAGKLIAEIYDECGEDSIVNPTFVCDYPVEVSPLSKRRSDDPRLTERFELVIAGHEYANAFSELNDPVDQEERFAAQVAAKDSGDDEAMMFDHDFVRALEYGMPPAGGIGIGIDRVVMLLTDSASIRDVLLFPHMRPEKIAASAEKTPAVEQTSCTEGEVCDCGCNETCSCECEISSEKIDFSKVEIEPLFEDMVDFDTFSKSDFRAVKVKACEAVKKSKKLLNFTLDDGTDTERTILSGIHMYYEPEELVGKTLLAITNLPPRKMMGIDSCGMLISAIHSEEGEERLNLIMLDEHIPAGAKMY